MIKRPEKPPLNIEIFPAAQEQESILANLLELYAHDFSEFHDVEIGADGRFGYKNLSLYWAEPNRLPFLVWVQGKLAGLVLVKSGSEVSGSQIVWDMAEFFVLRGYRKRGIGTYVAHEVWRKFPGQWEVRVMESNSAACEFWERAIAVFTGKEVHPVRITSEDGKSWKIFAFESPHIAE